MILTAAVGRLLQVTTNDRMPGDLAGAPHVNFVPAVLTVRVGQVAPCTVTMQLHPRFVPRMVRMSPVAGVDEVTYAAIPASGEIEVVVGGPAKKTPRPLASIHGTHRSTV